MSRIKFIDLLEQNDRDSKELKLIFNRDWDYDPNNATEDVKKALEDIDEPQKIELLDFYGEGKVELIKETTKTHDPSPKVRRFHDGEIVFCFIPYYNDWLLVNAYKVIDSSKHLIDVDENYMSYYKPYLGRLVIIGNDKTKQRNIRMKDRDSINSLEVREIMDEPYYKTGKKFPGYENVCLTWRELKSYIDRPGWQEALSNQKAIYLITDTSNGKHYVGKASGNNMLYNRWKAYIDTLHGGNKELKKLSSHHIKNNFAYSILEIFKSTTPDDKIDEREKWWKDVLRTKEFGYNDN